MRRHRLDASFGAGFGGVLAVLLAAALTGVRDQVPNTSVALVLVLIVLVGALAGGRVGGGVTAFVAVLCFDFFHTQPYGRLTIDSRDDVETALLLLVVGLVVGTLASRSGSARDAAETNRLDVRRLHRISWLVARAAPPAELVGAAEEELRGMLHLDGCRFERQVGPERLVRLERCGAMEVDVRRERNDALALPLAGVAIDVIAGGDVAGRFVLRPQPDVGVTLDERIAAVVLADLVAAGLASAPADRP